MNVNMNERIPMVNPVDFAKALADDTRQKIMSLCCCRWCSVNQLVEETGVSQPTVSHHLAVLRDSNLVTFRHEGKQTLYTLNQDNIASCCNILLQRFAPDSDPALKLTEWKPGES